MRAPATTKRGLPTAIAGTTLILTVLLTAGVSAGALIGMSRPSFCKTCHEMNPNYVAWHGAKHKDVPCVACHTKPGIKNFVVEKINALEELSAHISGKYHRPINERSVLSRKIPDENCLPCHPKPGRVRTKTIKYDHSVHKEEHRLGCAFCHNRTGHPGVTGYRNHLAMQVCVDCHKRDEGPTTECGDRHPKGFDARPASHKAQDWNKVHGKSKEDCLRCHKQAYCDDCHGIGIPHPKGWKSAHEERAEHFDPAVCRKCHEAKSCDDCHRREED